jgi:predicted NAD-dependent protein-ADP-ribosyltransferase YbiA (DUF1768 family)
MERNRTKNPARERNKGINPEDVVNTIVLKHANEKPFGPLRNDYKSDLFIDGKRWNSVNNYVYANLLPSIDFRKKTIEHVNPNNVERSYYEVKFEVDKSTLSSAIKIGIETKLNVDPQFRQALLNTAGNTILYLSKNNYLGYGNGKGFVNTYGIWLEHFRTGMLWFKAQAGKHPTLKDDQIYDSYLAEKGLRLALHNENLDKYLKIDIDANNEMKDGMVEVIKALIKKYGREKIFVIDKDTALALQRKRYIEPIVKATHLIRYIRKTSIRDVRNSNLEKMKELIFEAFVDDLMDSNYDDEEFERGEAGHDDKKAIMKNQFNTISIAEKNSLVQRTMKLYEAGALNQRVMEKADLIFKNTYIPSSSEIDRFESDTVPIPVAKPKNPHVDEPTLNVEELKDIDAGGAFIGTFNLGMVWVYPYLADPPIKFGTGLLEHNFEYDLLSPANDSVMLEIDGRLYPSISHYLIVRVAQTMPGYEGIGKAYSVIVNSENNLFFSVADSESNLTRLERFVYANEKTNLLHKAIRNKFEQRMFKDILIATGDKTLKYLANDIKIGEKHQGFGKPINIMETSIEYGNQSVNFMQRIRKTVLPEDVVFTRDTFKTSLEYDEFMEVFMVDKIQDISFTIKCVQMFCKHKDLPFVLTECFVKNVLETFYGECTPFTDAGKKKKRDASYPYRFEQTLTSQFQIKTKKETSFSMSTKSALLIFNKILDTLLNLESVLQNGELPKIGGTNETPLYATLFKIALMDSQWLLLKKDRRKDLRFDTKSKRNNDIISAIINIISLLHIERNEGCESVDTLVDEVDVKIATSILTGQIRPLGGGGVADIKVSKAAGSLRAQMIAEEEIQYTEDVEDVEDVGVEDIQDIEDREENDEEPEEEEGIDYEDELPEFDEEVYYEGVVRTISGHLESLGLDADMSIETEIKNAARVVEKARGNRLKINFYA